MNSISWILQVNFSYLARSISQILWNIFLWDGGWLVVHSSWLIMADCSQQRCKSIDTTAGIQITQNSAKSLEWFKTRAGKSKSLIFWKRLKGRKGQIWYTVILLAKKKYLISGYILNPESEGLVQSHKISKVSKILLSSSI